MKRLGIAIAVLAALSALAAAQTPDEVLAADRICAEHYHTVASRYGPQGYDPGWKEKCEPIALKAKEIRDSQIPTEKSKTDLVNSLAEKLK